MVDTTNEARTPLTRARICAAALRMIDRDGLEALSMRRLAAELDVSAMSLYNHVPNKDALLEGVTEALLREIDVSGAWYEDWAEGLTSAFHSFRRVLLAHPNLVPLIQRKHVVTPDAFRPVELSLATLRRAGFAAEDALLAHWALVGYTLGHVAFQIADPLAGPGAEDEVARRREMLPEDEFPNLFEVLPLAVSCDYDAAYAFGLDALIGGLKAKLGAAR